MTDLETSTLATDIETPRARKIALAIRLSEEPDGAMLADMLGLEDYPVVVAVLAARG